MSPTVARTHSFRRIAATITLAVIATMGITVATTPTASADTSAVSDDGRMSATISDMTLVVDNLVPGRPDVGDWVQYTVTLTAHESVDRIGIWQDSVLQGGKWGGIGAGDSQSFTVQRLVGIGNLGHLGAGPNFGDVTVSYRYQSGSFFGIPLHDTASVVVDGPPAFYTPGEPFTVSTTMNLTEPGVTADGAVREGDTVGYSTTVKNISGYVMVIDALPGYDDFTAPVVLGDGESAVFTRNPVTVTYADMVAGLVDFPDTEILWRAGYTALAWLHSGTYPVPVGSAPTEAIDNSFTYDVVTSVNDSTGTTPRALGTAGVGDRIDYTFELGNTGNVVIDYVSLEADTTAGGGSSSTNGSLDANLAPTQSLPNAALPSAQISSFGSTFDPYVLAASDVTLGYVDLNFIMAAAASHSVFTGDTDAFARTVNTRVFLREFNTNAQLKFAKQKLNDTNGDRIGQEGETVTYRVRFKNKADQSLRIDSAYNAAGSDIDTPVGGEFTGKTRAPSATIATEWTYTITAADEARGSIDVGVTTDYTGQADWATNSRTEWARTIDTGPYVAPPTTLDTSATYVDANADGFPSIGETVTVTVTAANVGGYPLTGLVVTDVAGSDVTGLLPAFGSTIAAGSSETQSFTYVLTAADFARGSFSYTSEMTADGMATKTSPTSVNLTGITFQAYASDLLTMAQGGISVCLPNLTPTDTVVIGSSVNVTPGGSCIFGGAPDGYRVVAFSTPLVLGTDTFSVVVPGAVGVGAHSLALYGPDGELVGWQAVQVKDPIAFSGRPRGATGTGMLAYSGMDDGATAVIAGGAAALVLLGTASMAIGLRPRRGGITSAL